MVLNKITYLDGKTKKTLNVELCDNTWKKFRGLMFRKNSPPLLFIFSKERDLTIHSFFCKPFIAIWLDGKMRVNKKLEIKKWMPHISGYGKYLLEVPLDEKISSSRVTKK